MAWERSRSRLRWAILGLSIIGMMGNYYCYDNPGALKNPLTHKSKGGFGDLSNVEYNLMYSVYSIPNTVLPLIGGIIVDKVGATKCLLMFNLFVFCGQALFALGLQLKLYWLSLMGRTIFGIGGESITVAQSTNLAQWFKGREMAMAMGLDISFSKLGSVINDYVSPAIADKLGLSYALWFGFLVCCLAVISTVVLAAINVMAERRARAAETANTIVPDPEAVLAKKAPAADAPVGALAKAKDFVVAVFNDVKSFNSRLWLITFSCLVVYATILPFNNISSDFMMSRYIGDDQPQADRLMSIPFAISAGLSPFLGSLVDRYGWRATLLVGSAMGLTLTHGLFAFTKFTPYFMLVFLGISYCIYAAALWPAVPLVCDERLVGTAYGFITMIQNSGLFAVPMLIGKLVDTQIARYPSKNTSAPRILPDESQNDYFLAEMFFFCVGLAGSLLSFSLFILDRQHGRVLERPHLYNEISSEAHDPLLAHADTEADATNNLGSKRVNATDDHTSTDPLH